LSCALTNQAQQVPGVAIDKLPNGLRIPAILKSSLSSQKSKVGDAVRLEVVADVHDKNGAVIIPRHSELNGRVTYVVQHEKNKQPAMLSFFVERVKLRNGWAALDAPVFGTDVWATDSEKGEIVEGIRAATLRHQEPLNLVNRMLMYDFRLSGNVPQSVHDTTMSRIIMQLKLSPDGNIRAAFVKEDGDLELPREFLVVLLNGMKVGS
jgi:hypothetical protein